MRAGQSTGDPKLSGRVSIATELVVETPRTDGYRRLTSSVLMYWTTVELGHKIVIATVERVLLSEG